MTSGNGSDPVSAAGLFKHFRHYPWQTQVALVIALAGAFRGAIAELRDFFRPDPVVAQTVIETNEVVKQLSLSQSLESNFMIYYFCQNERESPWMMSLGDVGIKFCTEVRQDLIFDITPRIYAR